MKHKLAVTVHKPGPADPMDVHWMDSCVFRGAVSFSLDTLLYWAYTAGYWNIPTTAHIALIGVMLIPDVKPGAGRYNWFGRHSIITTEEE